MNGKSAYDDLMHEVCVGLGFCGWTVDGEPLHVDMFIPESGPVSADEFVEWVFRAEGWDPQGEQALKHRASLRDAFLKHMGSDTVDAHLLRWSFDREPPDHPRAGVP
jgi:hypothetical protein